MSISENQAKTTPCGCSDDELINLIGAERCRTALTELYNRYRLPLGGFLQRHLSHSKLVEECYNDVMLLVWQHAKDFRGQSKVSTWIFSIAYRAYIATSKKESRHRTINSEEAIETVISQRQNEMIQRTRMIADLRGALADLPRQSRTIIELAYFHGYSINEISKIMDCPQNTAKTRLFYARKKLKAVIENHYCQPSGRNKISENRNRANCCTH